MRDYSTKIETVRIIYIQAYDDLAAGRLLSSDYERAAWIVHGLRHLTGTEAQAEDGLEGLGVSREAVYTIVRSISDEIDPRSDRRRTEARELEDAWARVRPILDDALEVEAVTYLRAHRHAFRVKVEQAEHVVTYWQMVTADPDGDAVVARERALGALKHVIEYADWWNQLISSVRRSALPDPKLKRRR